MFDLYTRKSTMKGKTTHRQTQDLLTLLTNRCGDKRERKALILN